MTGGCRCGCGRPVFRWDLGRTCYRRWLRWGRPAEVPPPRMRGRSRSRAARLEDYSELRSWGEGVSRAARRVGISERTAWRYEAERRQQDAQAVA